MYIFKRWQLRREMNRCCEAHDWERALFYARRLGDSEARKWIALARMTQLMREVEGR